MKFLTIAATALAIAVLSLPIMGQSKPSTPPATPPAVTAPALSTSDKVALSDLESKKQDLVKQYQGFQQEEGAILDEWHTAHAGYHINPQTFVVEKDAPASSSEPVAPVGKK